MRVLEWFGRFFRWPGQRRAIPTIIADNAGLDSADLVAQLRADHQENDNSYTGKLRRSSVNANTKWQSILILDPIIQAEN